MHILKAAFFVLILSTTLGMSKSKPVPSPTILPLPSPVITLAPSPLPSVLPGQPKVLFAPVEFYSTPAERVKIKSAGLKVNEIVQSQCFYDFMSKRALIQTNGRTPAQVATHLQSLTGTVPVNMYYRAFTSAMAYRQPPSMDINLNRKFFTTDMSDCKWASTLAHESLGHSLGGYDHDYNYNAARSFSVPYSMGGADAVSGGDAFKACCK